MDLAQSAVLFKNENHQFIWLGWAEGEEEGIIQTNQYLIIHHGKGILLDPGGVHLFSKVVAEISRFIDLDHIEHIFFSHQDPDVSSGIGLWLGITPAKIYLPSLWTRFIPHFGIVDQSRIISVPDKGSDINLPSSKLVLIPSHFLHSTGQLSLYDPTSKILFSGDIGGAIFEKNKRFLFVEDFNAYTKLMVDFHKRYMASNIACKKWVKKIKQYPVSMITPQHGGIFKDNTVEQFLNWLENLQCGIDLIDSWY